MTNLHHILPGPNAADPSVLAAVTEKILPDMEPGSPQTDAFPESPIPTPPPSLVTPRQLFDLFLCHICHKPYRAAVTLPCGVSICKTCIPETHDRPDISYPADPERQKGFACPVQSCGKEHTLGDCAADVVFGKVLQHVRDALEADESPLVHELRSLWMEAEGESPSSSEDEGVRDDLTAVQAASRSEMDCQICYALFHDPITTGCGHTFCRSCLYRILDHSRCCPICRQKVAISPMLAVDSCPTNEALDALITVCWPAEAQMRSDALAAEEAARKANLSVPLFICTLAFPLMPTFLHIFEPRYKLMIRRALENDRIFGMVQPKRPHHAGDANFYELGTLLRIVNVEFYPDGRCLLETVGLSRFRVVRHGSVDGYTVAETERIHDISLEDEEALEAAQVTRQRSPSPQVAATQESGDPVVPQVEPPLAALVSPKVLQDLEALSTQDLMRHALSFVARMQSQSAPWLAVSVLDIYGACPNDPAIFPWWLASILPIKAREKYRLLLTSSVRSRLKICCSWILEWQSRMW